MWAHGEDPDLEDPDLGIDGHDLDAPEPETVAVVRALSAGDLSEAAFAARLKEHMTSIGGWAESPTLHG